MKKWTNGIPVRLLETRVVLEGVRGFSLRLLSEYGCVPATSDDASAIHEAIKRGLAASLEATPLRITLRRLSVDGGPFRPRDWEVEGWTVVEDSGRSSLAAPLADGQPSQ